MIDSSMCSAPSLSGDGEGVSRKVLRRLFVLLPQETSFDSDGQALHLAET
jgi:hypothetical protein